MLLFCANQQEKLSTDTAPAAPKTSGTAFRVNGPPMLPWDACNPHRGQSKPHAVRRCKAAGALAPGEAPSGAHFQQCAAPAIKQTGGPGLKPGQWQRTRRTTGGKHEYVNDFSLCNKFFSLSPLCPRLVPVLSPVPHAPQTRMNPQFLEFVPVSPPFFRFRSRRELQWPKKRSRAAPWSGAGCGAQAVRLGIGTTLPALRPSR